MTKIVLGQISKVGLYKQKYGPLRCYTMTAKELPNVDNVVCLAPSKSIVYGYKGYTPYTEEQYTEQYVARLNANIKAIVSWYRAQQQYDTIALCCFCRKEWFCHRKIVYALFLWLNSRLDVFYDVILE